MGSAKVAWKFLSLTLVVVVVALSVTCLNSHGPSSQNTLDGGISILTPATDWIVGDSISLEFQSDQYSDLDSIIISFGDNETTTLRQSEIGDSDRAVISHVYSTPGVFSISVLMYSAGFDPTETTTLKISIKSMQPVIDSVVPGNNKCVLYWTSAAGTTSGNVFVAAGETVDKTIGRKIANVASPWTVDSLTNDNVYSFAVSAVSAGGESELSAAVSATPKRYKQFRVVISSTNGTVTRLPSQSWYDSGTIVMLTPVPAAGYRFTGWSGDLTGTSNPDSIIMTGSKSLTAGFAIVNYALTVSATNGTVTKSPDQASYDSGAIVSLTPVPAAGYKFTGWSGDLTGTASPGMVTMTGLKTVVAEFALLPAGTFALNVSATNGTVTKSPDQASYDSGAIVSLTPVPAAGYRFSGWSGDLTGTATPGTVTMTGLKAVTANFVIIPVGTFGLTVSATNGTVTKSPDQASYDSGAIVTLTPVPAAGYRFTGWNGDLSGTTNPGLVTMTGLKAVTANFAKIPVGTFGLTISATNGTVTKSPDQASYDSGAIVSLTPVPAAGFRFSGWSGDLTGTAIPGTVTMNGVKAITANFAAIPSYVLTITGTNGTVTANPAKAAYDSGTIVSLTPVPSAGYVFTGWGGDLAGTANPGVITMNGLKTVVANFVKVAPGTFSLNISAPNGSVTKFPDQTAYDSGTTVVLTPVPVAGYRFTGWSGDLNGTSNPASINMSGPKTVVASFTKIACTLTVTGTGGTVTKSPSLTIYDSGVVVTLTPTPAVGYRFMGWSGDLTGTDNPGVITMTGTKKVTANFAIETYFLTITGTHGTVTKSPNQASYDSGTVVTLTPVPAAGYQFSSWSGDLTGTANPMVITMSNSKVVTANFAIKKFALAATGTNGTVSRSPDLTNYDSGAIVTLTPVPAAGYRFTGWSGDITGTANPGSITMSSAKTVTANFAIQTYSINIIETGGMVIRYPNLTKYDSGTVLRLTATPIAGYRFTGWSGDLTGTANPGEIIMSSDKTVTANFALVTYTLTITATNGTVTKSPNQATYDSGVTVTLTPVPATGYYFSEWSGDATGSGSGASVLMTGNKAVTATFAPIPFTITFDKNSASATGTMAQQTIRYDSSANLTRKGFSNPGTVFMGWATTPTGAVQFRNGASYTMGLDSVILYARWLTPPSQMVKIPSANQTFLMGQAGSADLVHQVTFSKDFWMDTVEVTQADFVALRGFDPSSFTGGTLPVDRVTWYDAILYCNSRSKRDGLDTVYRYSGETTSGGVSIMLSNLVINYAATGYRLPTEPEWEFACRGGSTTAYWWGADTSGMGARSWTEYNSGSTTHVPGVTLANPYKLYDMIGNVQEWCNDWYEAPYAATSVTDPTGPATGGTRVLRGGGYQPTSNMNYQSADRSFSSPSSQFSDYGFRCVLPDK